MNKEVLESISTTDSWQITLSYRLQPLQPMVHLTHLYLNSLAVQILQETMPKAMLQSQYTTSTLSMSTEPAVTQGKQADFEMLRARAVDLVLNTDTILNTEGPIEQNIRAK